jgi:sec-independent protein translocase protein TatA
VIGGWQIIIVLLVILLLFGAKRIPELGKGLGRGIRSFKDGLQTGDEDEGRIEDGREDEASKKLPS